MKNLFTSESVSEGHPDKVADQISDAILDEFLRQDPTARVACETLVTTGLVVIAGEITSKATVDYERTVRDTIKKIGYTRSEYKFDHNSCAIITSIDKQSPDIAQGVDESTSLSKDQGAGDQGMMFGYATTETPEYMPSSLAFSHRLVHELAKIRKENLVPEMNYLRPDVKSQVTIEYDDKGKPRRVDTIVVSTQHDEFDEDAKMQAKIKKDIETYLIRRVIPSEMIDKDTVIHVNPTGKFVIGGPHGDTGLTGRKIIVDTYGGKGAHGGGAFSGKDPSKVDRSAAYAARHIAKNLVAAGVADEVLIQVAYAIGIAQPVSILVNTYGTGKIKLSDAEIAKKVRDIFDMRPRAIIERLNLLNPIYLETAAYGHVGRETVVQKVPTNYVTVTDDATQRIITQVHALKEVRFFPWEDLDQVTNVRTAFGL